MNMSTFVCIAAAINGSRSYNSDEKKEEEYLSYDEKRWREEQMRLERAKREQEEIESLKKSAGPVIDRRPWIDRFGQLHR
jgi:predicted phosphohydrolase